jgi:hypothetical protein
MPAGPGNIGDTRFGGCTVCQRCQPSLICAIRPFSMVEPSQGWAFFVVVAQTLRLAGTEFDPYQSHALKMGV